MIKDRPITWKEKVKGFLIYSLAGFQGFLIVFLGFAVYLLVVSLPIALVASVMFWVWKLFSS